MGHFFDARFCSVIFSPQKVKDTAFYSCLKCEDESMDSEFRCGTTMANWFRRTTKLSKTSLPADSGVPFLGGGGQTNADS